MAERRNSPVLADLKRRGLLRHSPPVSGAGEGPGVLLALCEAGALEGGLSVALDVRPDEAVGALCAASGGSAGQLRILDVRKEPFALIIQWAGVEERWDIPDVKALIHNLNDLWREEGSTCAIAVLGEWEDALQLWCISKSALRDLWGVGYFSPVNEDDLRPLAADD